MPFHKTHLFLKTQKLSTQSLSGIIIRLQGADPSIPTCLFIIHINFENPEAIGPEIIQPDYSTMLSQSCYSIMLSQSCYSIMLFNKKKFSVRRHRNFCPLQGKRFQPSNRMLLFTFNLAKGLPLSQQAFSLLLQQAQET